jgi:DnaJ family protein C protein 17
MALDAKLRIQEARKQRYANFDKKRKAMLEELEEAEQADKKAKSAEAGKRQKYAQEAEQIRDAGRRMVEERQAELRRQQQKETEIAESAQEELDPPPLGAYIHLHHIVGFPLMHDPPKANTTPPSASDTRSPSTPT